MKSLKSKFILFLLLFVMWIFLTNTSIQEIIVGLVLSVLIVLILNKYGEIFSEIKINPKAFVYGFMYIFVFIVELAKANYDVARRVVDPKLPINPGIIKVKTKLKSRIGRIILANSITLTPGTLTVETKGDNFYIHWIDVTSESIEESTEEIVSKFEKYLKTGSGRAFISKHF